MLKNIYVLVALSATLVVSVACDEEKPPVEEKKIEVVQTPAPKSAEQVALEEKAAAEAAKKAAETAAAEAAAEAALKEDPLTECCRALAQVAMFQRSAEHKKGETVCGMAMTEKKPFAEAVKEIEAKLEGKPLPEPCKPK